MSVPQHKDDHEHAHPGVRTYVEIAIILAIITSIEVAVYYIPALEDFLVYILLVLSALKFVIVVGYFMHLKFDNRLFTYVFGFGMVLGIGLVTSFLALFNRF
jgi:cytochrome c oxidase subunit 4